MKDKKIALVIIVLITLIFIGIYACNKFMDGFRNDNETLSDGINKTSQAVDFTLKDLNDQKISLSDYKGKKVFVNFWATWCPPCKYEMPFINEIYKENKDIEILTISSNESKNIVEKYIKQNNYEFKVLLDTDSKVATKYRAYSIPLSILIDEDGNIIKTHNGAMNKDQLKEFISND